MQQREKKASGFAAQIQLSSNLLSSLAASRDGRPVFPCLLCVPNDSGLLQIKEAGQLLAASSSFFLCAWGGGGA